jgi:hypothetical protein
VPALEALSRIAPELLDVLHEHIVRREAADEELEEERVRGARLDQLEPGVERLPAPRA